MTITRFEEIDGWKAARNLTSRIYEVSKRDLFFRDFGLRDQIRRASGSIMHNVAEGFDSGSNLEFIKFLRYSQRSCTEVQSELYIALDQAYVSQQEFDDLYSAAAQTRSMIGGFIRYLLDFEVEKKSAAIKQKSGSSGSSNRK